MTSLAVATQAPPDSPPAVRERKRSPQSADQERALFVRWRRDGDGAARDELVARFSSLSRTLARRYRNTSEPQEASTRSHSWGS